MEKFMLGRKAGMTQLFTEDGTAVPVTVLECGPVSVVQVKTVENDGYTSVKVGYGEAKEKKLNKPAKGQFTKAGISAKKFLREFRTAESFDVGQEIKVSDMFAVGDKVDISGVSKGKGYAGVIKRYNQRTGPKTHGSMYHRRVGSMGANTDPARVFKGKKLPGHMGAVNVTVQNLEVVLVDGERNIIALKGAVPGPKGGGILEIRNTVKSGR
ncbi:MAG: 50S ribosomal protein L3 [Eubacteriales bacterium]|nr:50S ribosomal protein L3 [Eubacteriales bacterium]MDD4326648.1 50S ribosomal protein L3 [Eubacteriales bacterium]MDD4717010.1 50S ribosomal protein L3 [Eubacteriales bacterium]NCU25602.1 50S ribosomal protein L3 [Candidatus Nomurabacteria bacterium]